MKEVSSFMKEALNSIKEAQSWIKHESKLQSSLY